MYKITTSRQAMVVRLTFLITISLVLLTLQYARNVLLCVDEPTNVQLQYYHLVNQEVTVSPRHMWIEIDASAVVGILLHTNPTPRVQPHLDGIHTLNTIL
ncbi:hypothetical protein F5Y02DRAFT_31935 [Annulohypoxylon stygium]|nr:hypothetical protein F5Y02DRAFT_31935 [Annulohypoxylon stygium]